MSKRKEAKTSDLQVREAALILLFLNEKHIKLEMNTLGQRFIISSIDPDDLVYPEGWYNYNGLFTNKEKPLYGDKNVIPMYRM